MHFEKHTTWLAYVWALISGICAQWSLNDYGALIGILLGIGTFLVNKHYKKKTEQAQTRQAAALEERNRLIGRILEKNDHDSTLKMLAVSEMPEDICGAKDES
ncbi:HP1 family phage holin [Salmonella enterica subsp. enterica serovar Newport]